MKKVLFIGLFSLFHHTIFAQSDKIKGVWLTQDQEAHVQISFSNNEYFGEIKWLKTPLNPETQKPWLDTENKDESRKKMTIMGSKMLWGFSYKDGSYVNGQVYDSRDGATYTGKLWLQDENTLKMRGYWGIFYSTETWTRVR